jgi:hypothetical protein
VAKITATRRACAILPLLLTTVHDFNKDEDDVTNSSTITETAEPESAVEVGGDADEADDAATEIAEAEAGNEYKDETGDGTNVVEDATEVENAQEEDNNDTTQRMVRMK